MSPHLGGRAAALRREFDASFARPATTAAPDMHDLLAIRIAGQPYALRLRDVTMLVGRRKLVPVPSASPYLSGLAGVRGAIVPVFALAALLDHGEAAPATQWLVLSGAAREPLALAFDELDGHLRVPGAAIVSASAPERPLVREVVRGDGPVRAVIDVPLAVARLRRPHEEEP